MRRTLHLVFFSAILSGLSAAAVAQRVISGRVTSPQDTGGLPGVNIAEKGTSNGTVTDLEGNYSIRVAANATLVFSFIGYTTREIPVGNQTHIDVTLESDVTALSEVIVVAYGIQEEKTISGSVAKVEGTEILRSPAVNVSNNLAGRVPGLVAVAQSGEPGADGSTLLVRGINTLGNNAPLVVVDGVPFRSLERIDPSAIESISVVKDASAAIYGSLAANGVILITTKQGKAGSLEVTANFNQAFSRPTIIPEVTTSAQWARLYNEMVNYGYGNPQQPKFTHAEIRRFEDGSDPWRYPDTNWFNEVLKPRSPQNYANITLSGGSEITRVFVSLSNRFQDGFFRNGASFYKQQDLMMNIMAKPGKNLDLNFGVTGRLEDGNFPTRGAARIFGELVGTLPTFRARWPDGRIGEPTDPTEGSNPVANSTPLGGANHSQNYVFNINGSFTLRIPAVKGLSLTGTAAFDRNFRFSKFFSKPLHLWFWDGSSLEETGLPLLSPVQTGEARLDQRHDISGGYMTNLLINHEITFFTHHTLKSLVGIERLESQARFMSAFRDDFVGTTIDDLWAGSPDGQTNMGATFGKNRWQNYFGRINYAFKDRYLAEFVWRYQGTSKFHESVRFGFFPGISLAYRISEEPFWKQHLAFVESYKLRGSFGVTGNDLTVPPFQFLGTYAGGPFNFVSTHPDHGAIIHNNTLVESFLPAPNTTWEQARQMNVGFDMELLKSRLSITFDYFNNLRTHIQIQRIASIPGSAGFTSLPFENIGRVRNAGFDFNIMYRNSVQQVQYQIGFNGVYSRNKIEFFDEQPGIPEHQRQTGRPLFTELYYEAIGIYRTQADLDAFPSYNNEAVLGDLIFRDLDNNGVINALDMKRIERNQIPIFSMGLNLNAQYKGFDVAILIQGAFGAVRYNRSTAGINGNFLRSFYDQRWSPDNPDGAFPRTYSMGAPYWNASDKFNTFWLRATDYVRLKNVEVGYSIPPKLVRKIGLQRARLSANALNLFTVAPALRDFGVDPEMQAQADGFSGQGYPLQKIINMGISVTF
jgi:TonB-linked SusC/RagA family outer membrane protein